ncbi:MAG: ornithine carbamoyltransferase [Dehalococcoidia bacterium]|nr:ornithine carbamoyltransferase [Dehalococcoidia bacterium]
MAISTGLLSIADLTPEETQRLIQSAAFLKRRRKSRSLLKGKTVALLFEKPSLRTRVSFEVAMWQLGGYAIYLSPAEVGLGKRESIADVARTLSRFVDAIVARTFAHETVELLAKYGSVPVINGLSDHEHPCQALGDLLTIQEKKGHLKGLRLAYVGDGNNVARSLILGAAAVGMDFAIASPPGYELDKQTLRQAKKLASESGARITTVSEPRRAVAGADVVYTDVWVSMGQEAESEMRRRAFAAYQVDAALLSKAKEGAVFMHPLPGHHGEEIAEGLLDHPQSVVFDQAENRLHIQKAILVRALGGKPA